MHMDGFFGDIFHKLIDPADLIHGMKNPYDPAGLFKMGQPATPTASPVATYPAAMGAPTGGASDFLPHGKYFPYVVAGGAVLAVAGLLLLSKKRGRRR